MMGHWQKLDGDGFDAFTGWRRLLRWRAGERAKVKRAHTRRARRQDRMAAAESDPTSGKFAEG